MIQYRIKIFEGSSRVDVAEQINMFIKNNSDFIKRIVSGDKSSPFYISNDYDPVSEQKKFYSQIVFEVTPKGAISL